jgi:Tol biopolymer transport system component
MVAVRSAAAEIRVAKLGTSDARRLEMPQDLEVTLYDWSADGNGLLYGASTGYGNATSNGDVGNLFFYDLSTDRSTKLTDLRLRDVWWFEIHPKLSPDGRRAVFELPRNAGPHTRWDVWSVPVTGGEEPALEVRDAAFPLYLADGSIAHVPDLHGTFEGDTIAVANTDGTRETWVRLERETFRAYQISPDRQRIAFAEDRSVYVLDIRTGEVTEVATGETVRWVGNETLYVEP